ARTRHARQLFAPLGQTYDRYARLLSFSQDPRWRSFLVSRVPPDALRVLDVAAGTAAVAIELARAQPARTVVGVDQSPEMLEAGRDRGAQADLSERAGLRDGRGEGVPGAAAVGRVARGGPRGRDRPPHERRGRARRLGAARVTATRPRPAFYALRSGGWRDYVTLLHPPYTLWHLSYFAVGAALAPR